MSLTNTTASVTNIVRGLIHDAQRTDGRDSYVYVSDSVFTLTEDFISSSTIAVFKNGTQLSSGDFSYDSDNNQVTVTASLTANDVILIKYSYFKKYSDTEVQGFLESSLAYFPLYQYKKTFEINSDNKIVAINGLDPTSDELYFIAIIASILIDPQNVKISIPDLNITPVRDESDQTQIKKAFIQFKAFVGTIYFER